jgi:hypothetical protein
MPVQLNLSAYKNQDAFGGVNGLTSRDNHYYRKKKKNLGAVCTAMDAEPWPACAISEKTVQIRNDADCQPPAITISLDTIVLRHTK